MHPQLQHALTLHTRSAGFKLVMVATAALLTDRATIFITDITDLLSDTLTLQEVEMALKLAAAQGIIEEQRIGPWRKWRWNLNAPHAMSLGE